MRRKFFGIQVLTALLAATSPSALAGTIDRFGMDVDFKVAGDHFYLTVDQYYPPGTAIKNIRKTFTDPALATTVSNIITQVRQKPMGNNGYRLETTATVTKFHISVSKTTANLCTETVDDREWERRCTLDAKDATNRSLFVGGAGDSEIVCARDPEDTAPGDAGVRCTFTINARPSPMRFPLRRSSQRLAAAGAQETVHDLGALFLVLTTGASARDAKARYESSKLAQNMERVFEDTNSMQDGGKLKGKILDIKTSDRRDNFDEELTDAP